MGKNLQSPKSEMLGKPFPARWVKALLLTLLAVLIVSIIILSCVPPVSKDALVHHLAVPKLYLKHGGIYELPFMPFSYFPMNLDMIYMIPLYFENDMAPKFIHFSFALLTAWVIFTYLRRKIDIIYALLGVILFLSIPIIVKLSTTVYVDLGLIFFSTASLLLVMKWGESRFRLRFLIFSAIFCGLAVGTKYNGLIVLLVLALFVPFLHSRTIQDTKPNFLKSAGYGILFLFVAFMVFSPWMIKNYLWTNNPIFPLYDQWFNPQEGIAQKSMGLFGFRAMAYKETWWEMALLPVRVFFQGQDGNPQYFDGKLNPFLFFLPFFAFYGIRRDPQILRNEKKIMMAFAVLFFAFAFFSSDLRTRYISPIIPPLVILSIFGIRKLSENVGNFRRPIHRKLGGSILILIIFFSFLLNANYILIQYGHVKPFDYLKGTLTRDEYIAAYRHEYPAMRYMNDHLPSDARILFIFLGKRGYYCDRAFVFDMNRDRSTLRQLVKRSDKPEEIMGGLKGMGISHLFVNSDIFHRWVRNNFTQKDQKLLGKFFEKYVNVLFVEKGYGVYGLGGLPL